MLKSPCICTTFSRFNIFDEKMLKKLEMLKFSIFFVQKIVTGCAGDTTLLYHEKITLILRSQKKKMVQRFLRNGCRPWSVFEAEKIAKLIKNQILKNYLILRSY